jgi:hypothetical protein
MMLTRKQRITMGKPCPTVALSNTNLTRTSLGTNPSPAVIGRRLTSWHRHGHEHWWSSICIISRIKVQFLPHRALGPCPLWRLARRNSQHPMSCENYKKHTNILCGENAHFLDVTPNGGVRGESASTDICLQEAVNILTTSISTVIT